MNILIPMAGAGSRFVDAGYTTPKPFIEVNGKPIFRHVTDSLNLNSKRSNFIFVIRKEHLDYSHLLLFNERSSFVVAQQLTEGAACTALLAKKHIDTDEPLLIVDSDTIFDWDVLDFLYDLDLYDSDGCVVTYKTSDPSKSFTKISKNGLVTLIVEKNPISNSGLVGIYYWKYGRDFVRYAEQMIEKNIRVNNEFYISQVYNEAIGDNKIITTHSIPGIHCMGTPEEMKKSVKELWGIDI